MKDPLFGTKLAGAFLLSLLILMLVGFVTDQIFSSGHGTGEKQAFAYPVEVPDAPSAGGEVEAAIPFSVLLENADLARGEKLTKRCTSCHTFNKGGANKIGPNLYGIINVKAGQNSTYSYSAAFRGLDRVWGYDELDAFITKPSRDVPGTKMSYAGLRDAEDRANLIRYLAENGDNPPPPYEGDAN